MPKSFVCDNKFHKFTHLVSAMKTSKIFKVLGVAILAAILMAGNVQAASNKQKSPEKVVIAQFGQAKFLLYLPLYIAMEEGLFAKRGLDVSLKFAGNDDQIFAAVIGGSADFGMGDPVFTAISKEKGGPGKVVAMLITKLGFSGYTNNQDIKFISDVGQLDNLRVGSFPDPSTIYVELSQIKRNKAPNMKIVPAAFGAQLATLEAGKIDIAVDLEPTVSIAEDKGYRVVLDVEKYTQPQAITGITTTEELIKNNPERVQKVVDALQEAVTLLHDNPDVSFRTAKKLFPDLKDSVIRSALERMKTKEMYPKSVVIPDEYWQRTLQARINSGDLKKPQASTVAVDNSFAVKAAQGRAIPKK